MNFSTLDLVIIGIVGASTLLSFFRGLLSEFLSLATWVFAICMPLYFNAEFALFLPASIESPTARTGISAMVLFVGALLFGGIITFLVRKVLSVAGLGFADRLFGTGFGALRGVVIVALMALISTGWATIPQEKWWNQSLLLPHVLKISRMIHARLPADVAKFFHINDR